MSKIVVSGDPLDGFSFWGPFRTMDEAEEYRDSFGDWVADLHRPNPPFDSKGFPMPKYPLGHRFFELINGKIREMEVCRVVVSSVEGEESVKYSAKLLSDGELVFHVSEPQLGVVTKQKLLDELGA